MNNDQVLSIDMINMSVLEGISWLYVMEIPGIIFFSGMSLSLFTEGFLVMNWFHIILGASSVGTAYGLYIVAEIDKKQKKLGKKRYIAYLEDNGGLLWKMAGVLNQASLSQSEILAIGASQEGRLVDIDPFTYAIIVRKVKNALKSQKATKNIGQMNR